MAQVLRAQVLRHPFQAALLDVAGDTLVALLKQPVKLAHRDVQVSGQVFRAQFRLLQ